MENVMFTEENHLELTFFVLQFRSYFNSILPPYYLPVLRIQIHWIWILILNFCPIWIRFRIRGYLINFKKKNKIYLKEKLFSKKISQKTIRKTVRNGTWRNFLSVEYMNCEFMSSIFVSHTSSLRHWQHDNICN